MIHPLCVGTVGFCTSAPVSAILTSQVVDRLRVAPLCRTVVTCEAVEVVQRSRVETAVSGEAVGDFTVICPPPPPWGVAVG